MSEGAFVDNGGAPEISEYAADAIESWRRTLAAASDNTAIGIFERAAIELFRVAETQPTASARQAVMLSDYVHAELADSIVCDLQNWATAAA